MPAFAATEISIQSAACRHPGREVATADLFAEEDARSSVGIAESLGIEAVRLCEGETGSELALAAATEAMQRAGVGAADLDVIVDFTILPQERLVPAWSMGNKLQADLGAKKAFTLGFSGGGASNFIACLTAAASLLAGDEGLDTALLVAADVTIPGNRVLNPERPVTVLGDGASALVLRRGDGGDRLVATRLRTEGALHDVCHIRGGAIKHPERTDLYRLVLDVERSAAAPKMEILRDIVDRLLVDAGVSLGEVGSAAYTNISAADQAAFAETLGLREPPAWGASLRRHGHIQGTDLVRNYLSTVDDLAVGEHVLLASHGMGYMYGAALVRRGS